MPKLFDRVKVNIGTTSTGTVTFGPASSGAFNTPAEAGAADGDTVRYVIVDGTDYEEGVGTILSSVGQMARTTVTRSKIGGSYGAAKINLSGTAVLAFVSSAADILNPANNLGDVADKPTALGTLGGAAKASNLSDLAQKYTAKDNITLRGADIASASTIDLEAATGDLVAVTGNVAVTGITLADGHKREVRFTGAPVLTHGASLILPGATNIPAAAGDFAVFRGYAAGVVRCTSYTKFSGRAVVEPATGIPDLDRWNALLDAIYLSKALGDIRRGVNRFVTGFKAGTAALLGINAVSSTNCDISNSAASGNVAPSPTTSSGTSGRTPGTGPNTVLYTVADRTWTVPNSVTVTSMGIYSPTAQTLVLKILRRNSSTNYDVLSSESFSHPGGGWADKTLSTPVTTPSTGTLYAAVYWSVNSYYDLGISRAFFLGEATGSGVAFGEDVSAAPAIRATWTTGYNNMTLVTSPQATDSNISNFRATFEIDTSLATPTPNTDFKVEGTSNFRSATVTMAIASPGVIAHAAHGLAPNTPVTPSTTGALLTGLAPGVEYFVKTVVDADHYTLSATAGGAAIATTGSQSGVHTMDFSTYTAATLSLVTAKSQNGRSVYETPDQAIAPGSLPAIRYKTLTNKNIPPHGLAAIWH